jgi:hypothetical protein
MTTCRTCGCQTDTPALAFLHERMHASLASLGLSEATFVDLERIADVMEAYASRHALDRAEVVRVLREYIDKSYGIRMEWGVEAREHVEELAHRLGLAGELGTREG